MEPSPVGVEHNLARYSGATCASCACTLLPAHRRMSLGLKSANQLRSRSGEERKEDSLGIHDGVSEVFGFVDLC